MVKIIGRVPTGEQTFGYSKTFISTDNTYSAKPMTIQTAIRRTAPDYIKRNAYLPYGAKNQR